MTSEDIHRILTEKFSGENRIRLLKYALQDQFLIDKNDLVELCMELYSNPKLYFDYLACITGIDNGPEKNTMEVLYHINSLVNELRIVLKVVLPRERPEVHTVSHIWRTANWHEREAYDMFGILFTNHPDLRRILMPADWQGFPLRKDYSEQYTYHGIKVKY
ncbi:MAG: NADH-quinone oxidoreductase subunit C [Cytophagaceae bacterium]|nr:NADH-quinone oxidoreductase subunit C [Cytophagaceae bacterium]MDW8456025.1 NADH-quinone oxidoreductase subunit C [Cytophagaceae bacterium]